MEILITSGATREYIDAARCITNISTGQTGRIMADTLAGLGCRVTCLAAEVAELPVAAGVELRRFVSFASLEKELRSALAEKPYDAVIHLAAISDYSPVLIEAGGLSVTPDRAVKLESSVPEMKITLRRNYKLLDRIKTFAAEGGRPRPFLVGFKLTSGASQDTVLRKVALLKEADLVAHNDLSEMKNSHPYHLYRKGMLLENIDGTAALASRLYPLIKEAVCC